MGSPREYSREGLVAVVRALHLMQINRVGLSADQSGHSDSG